VNVLNTEGYIKNLSREGCIEVPAIVDAHGIHPEFVGSLPEGFAAQIRLQHSIQKLLVEAYQRKSKKLLLQALLLDPVVDSAVNAKKLLEYMLEIQSEYLPEFHE
jgi:alpha-galactosidase